MIPRSAATAKIEPWSETWALGPGGAIAAATHFRSTWVLASMKALEARGHFARYRAHLAADRAEAILFTWAGTWMPMKLARTHYEACDALGLSRAEQFAMGLAVNALAQQSILRVAVRLANAGGASPWLVIPHMHRLWAGAANGGTVTVKRLGPKDGRVVVDGCELFDVPYFATAFAGVALGIVKLFREHAYCRLEPSAARGRCSLRLQWA